MSHLRLISRFGLPALSAGLLVALLGVVLGPAQRTQAAVVEGGRGPQLLIGRDDDNIDNADIQAGAAANQSLNRTDIIDGGPGNDVIFGLNGNDVIDGGPGQDIILGGPDGGAAPGGPPMSETAAARTSAMTIFFRTPMEPPRSLERFSCRPVPENYNRSRPGTSLRRPRRAVPAARRRGR